MSQERHLVARPQKLIAFLQTLDSGSRSGKSLRRILEDNVCKVNGRVERFGSVCLQKGDVVELASFWKSHRPATQKPLETLYEDGLIRLVDKPIGWVCSKENCQKEFQGRWQLVHRLDRDTTGVLLLARPKAQESLMKLFADRAVEKKYLALVDGIPREEEGIRDTYLVKKSAFEGQTIWGSGGKAEGLHAMTRWKVLARGKNASLLECMPITGRTHQIRVHLAEMGHPILVDRQYAGCFRSSYYATRPLLHASQLCIPWQGGHVTGQSPLPLDMRQAIFELEMEVGHLREFFGKDPHEHRRHKRQDDEYAEKVE